MSPCSCDRRDAWYEELSPYVHAGTESRPASGPVIVLATETRQQPSQATQYSHPSCLFGPSQTWTPPFWTGWPCTSAYPALFFAWPRVGVEAMRVSSCCYRRAARRPAEARGAPARARSFCSRRSSVSASSEALRPPDQKLVVVYRAIAVGVERDEHLGRRACSLAPHRGAQRDQLGRRAPGGAVNARTSRAPRLARWPAAPRTTPALQTAKRERGGPRRGRLAERIRRLAVVAFSTGAAARDASPRALEPRRGGGHSVPATGSTRPAEQCGVGGARRRRPRAARRTARLEVGVGTRAPGQLGGDGGEGRAGRLPLCTASRGGAAAWGSCAARRRRAAGWPGTA